MTYRPPSRPPRGAWALQIHAGRRHRDWSQTQAFEHLREGLNLGPKSRASYAALDMGDRQPKPAEAEYLASVFGWPVESGGGEEIEEEASPLVSALERQARAIEALVEELRLERVLQTEGLSIMLQGLGSLGADLDPLGRQSAGARGVRAGTPR